MSNTAELLATLLSGFFPPRAMKRASLPPSVPQDAGEHGGDVEIRANTERTTFRLLRLVGRYRERSNLKD
jgi:hypothetical protein